MNKKQSENWFSEHPVLTGIFAVVLMIVFLMAAFGGNSKVNEFTDDDFKIIKTSLDSEINFGGCGAYTFSNNKITMYCDYQFPTPGNLMIIKRIAAGIITQTDTPMNIDVDFYLRDGTFIDNFPNSIIQK